MTRTVARLALAILLGAAALWHFAAPATAPAQVQQGFSAPAAAAGRTLFASGCASCHGQDARGLSGRGPSLRGVGALAADFYLSTGYMPLQNLYDQPRRSRVLFSDRDLKALVAYVASFSPGPPIPQPDPASGSVSQGMRLFTQNCAGCHQIATAGGYLPDSVAPPLEADSARQIAEAVRIGPNLMPRFSTSLLPDGDLNSVIAYIQYARSPDDRGGWPLAHIGPVPEGLVAWFVAGVVLVGVTLTVGRRLA